MNFLSSASVSPTIRTGLKPAPALEISPQKSSPDLLDLLCPSRASALQAVIEQSRVEGVSTGPALRERLLSDDKTGFQVASSILGGPSGAVLALAKGAEGWAGQWVTPDGARTELGSKVEPHYDGLRWNTPDGKHVDLCGDGEGASLYVTAPDGHRMDVKFDGQGKAQGGGTFVGRGNDRAGVRLELEPEGAPRMTIYAHLGNVFHSANAHGVSASRTVASGTSLGRFTAVEKPSLQRMAVARDSALGGMAQSGFLISENKA